MSIVNAIEDYEAAAIKGGQLQDDRAKAMDYYLGKPFGNEITGRSQVVSRDVSDSIEWIKPALLKVFTAGDEVVAFTPKNEEDIQGAQQESDYANYIITQKNEWFTTAYVWFTDALIQKNGYVLAYWDETEDVEKEKYVDQTAEALTMVYNDPEVEIVESSSKPNPYMPGEQLYDFTLQKKTSYGCAKYLNLPPERTVYDTMHPDIRVMHSNFFEHWDYKTLSQLKEEGYEVPDDIGDETSGIIFEKEEQSRNRYGEDFVVDNGPSDKTMRKVKVRECWVRYDDNEDGIAELLHCVVVGKTVLLKEECDFIPVACLSPYLMPHRHIGISVAEKVMEIQEIKSALQRGFLDNVYLGINGRHAIDSSKVNLDDMLTSRPGGVVRTEGPPGQSIMPLVHQSNFQPILAGVEYFDQVREGRTGSSKASQQMSADALTKAPSGVAIAQLMSASQALSELVARVFAETGVKDLYLMVHALSLKHARKAEIVRLRNEFVQVDPRQWKKRVDMTVAVGLGTGNRDAQMAHLGQIVELEIKLLPTGLSSLKTAHHALSKFTQAAGFKDATAFWEDVSKQPPKPPPPDPKMVEAQGKMQIKQAELAQKGQAAQQSAQTDQAQAAASIQLEREKAYAQSQLERDKASAQVQLEREKAMAKIEIEREKAAAKAANEQTKE